MFTHRRLRCITAATALALAFQCGAQSVGNTSSKPTPALPHIALVLSGGGARGLAHIGVLKALDAAGIQPDIVTGTSMGALIGGLYAIGYSANALDSLVRRIDWSGTFNDAPAHRYRAHEQRVNGDRTLITMPMRRWRPTLPSGAVSGQTISRLLDELTWPARNVRDFRQLPRMFAAVATDIETGQAVVLDHGSLSEVMRASMSLPSVFEPVRVDGRLLVDGGVVRNLPASDARALGATFIICSNVSQPLLSADRIQSLTDVVRQSMAFGNVVSGAEQRKQCDIEIRPDVSEFGLVEFNRLAEIIARGDSAAQLQSEPLTHATNAARTKAPVALLTADQQLVQRIEIHGVTAGRAERLTRQALSLRAPLRVSSAGIDAALQRAYATELFDHISYRLDTIDGESALIVSVTPRTQDRVGFGFRFDDTYRAALLFTVVAPNWLSEGSKTLLELRLGTQLRAAAEFRRVSSRHPRVTLGVAMSALKTPLPLVDDSLALRVAEFGLTVEQLRVFTTTRFGQHGGVTLEAMTENALTKSSIAVRDTAFRSLYGALGASVGWDALDQPVYPHRGFAMNARSTFARGRRGNFTQHLAWARAAIPLSTNWTIVADGTAGTSTGDERLPPHRNFQLGGIYTPVLLDGRQISFVGLRHATLIGPTVVKTSVTIQWQARRNVFVTNRNDAGYVGNTLTLDGARYRTGSGVGVGALTGVGLVEMMVSTDDFRNRTRWELNIGRMF
jgi:NTE family protein